MHATSLQTLVMLVAQAAPGGSFQPANENFNVPDLLSPPEQVTRDQADPTAPIAPEDRTVQPAPALPAVRGSQFTPEPGPPADSNRAPASVLNTGPTEPLGVAEDKLPDTSPARPTPNAQIEFTAPGLPERGAMLERGAMPHRGAMPDRAAAPLQAMPARSLAADAPPARLAEARNLMEQALTVSDNSAALPGSPTTLRQALAQAGDRNERIAVIKTYWQLAVAIADRKHAGDELATLSQLPAPLDGVDGSRLTAAVTAASARLTETKLVLLATRHDLAEHMKSGATALPWTSDAPFVGVYEPRFQQMFAGRPAPTDLRKLAESFPLYLELVNARAASVGAAENAFDTLIESYSAGNVTFDQILEAFRKLRDERIAFLATVRDYNNAIADYSLNTIASGTNTDAVIATLIETEPVPSVLISSGEVRPASGVTPLRIAGQPTPARPLSEPSSRLVPVTEPEDQFVPRQAVPTVPAGQPTPVSPQISPIPENAAFQR